MELIPGQLNNLNEDVIIEEDGATEPSKTYRLDLEEGRIIGEVDEIEAVRQFIKKVILTERYEFFIYSNDYGTEKRPVLDNNNNATENLIKTELKRNIIDALMIDGRIVDIYDFSFEFNTNKCYIYFTVDTIFGIIKVADVEIPR